MKNYMQPGCIVDLTAPSGGVVSGSPVLIGSLLAVPIASAAEDETFAGALEGVFTLAKATSQTWSQGAKLYWDNSGKKATTSTGGGSNRFIGHAVADAATNDTTGVVRLQQSDA